MHSHHNTFFLLSAIEVLLYCHISWNFLLFFCFKIQESFLYYLPVFEGSVMNYPGFVTLNNKINICSFIASFSLSALLSFCHLNDAWTKSCSDEEKLSSVAAVRNSDRHKQPQQIILSCVETCWEYSNTTCKNPGVEPRTIFEHDNTAPSCPRSHIFKSL